MPSYSYSVIRDGVALKTVEKTFPMGEAPQRIVVDGEEFVRDLAADFAGKQTFPQNWPLENWALGVQPWQREEAIRAADAAGVPTEYNEKGNAIVRDKAHYRRLLKFKGMHNKDAGYMD